MMNRRCNLKALATAAAIVAGSLTFVNQAQRMAVLLCEQYYDFAEELADQYLVMERGEVIARGPGSEMKEKNIQQLVAI
jgi:ABC-type branched-subunit amino acid transport system ATPase component